MIQTSLILDGSAVMGLPRPEIPPTAHLGLRPYVTTFVSEYLHQSPLALLSVVVARNGVAQLASPLSTSEEGILSSIETGYFLVNPPLGMMSLENSLRVALASLEIDVDKELGIIQKQRHHQQQQNDDGVIKGEGDGGSTSSNPISNSTKKASNACQRKIVVVTGSVSVLDPGDVLGLIRDVCIPHNIVIDVVSLTGATRVFTSASDLTGGQFHCPLSGGGEHLLKIMETVALLRAVHQSTTTTRADTTFGGDKDDAEEDGLSYLLGDPSSAYANTNRIGMKRQRGDVDVDLSMVVSMGLPQSLYATNVDLTSTSMASSHSSLPQSLGCIIPLAPTTSSSQKDVGAEEVNIVDVLPDVRCPRCASVVSLPSVCPVCCLIVSSLPLMHTTHLTMNGTVSGTSTAPGGSTSSSQSGGDDEILSKLVVRCSLCGVQGVDTHARDVLVESIKRRATSSDVNNTTSSIADVGVLKAQCIAILLCDRLGLEGDWVYCGGCSGRKCEQCHVLVAKSIGFCPTCL